MILDPLFYGYEVTASLIPFVAVFLLYRKYRPHQRCLLHTYCGLLLFVLYVVAVFYVTGTGTLYDGLRGVADASINLIPFSLGFDLREGILNIIMLIPLGCLLPFIWKNMSLAQTVGLGFLFSLLIEISQLLNFRASDVNDLILNTAGALGGFGIYQIGHRALGYIKRHRNRGTLCVPNKSTLRNASHTPDEDFTESTSSATSQKNLAPLYANGASPFKEALICLFALFAGNFFLYNPLVLVSLVYG